MSVAFYCTTWVIAKKSEDLDAITNEQLLEIAIQPRSSLDEGQACLTEARRIRTGKIESKTQFKIKMYAGESRGHCLYPTELSAMHPNLLFVEISGADCTQEELISLVKDGRDILNHRGVIPYGHELFYLLKSDVNDENLYDKVEKSCCELINMLTGEDFRDAFRQDYHEDFDA